MDTIENVIRNIDGLFPVDSQYEVTRNVGEKLLSEAKRNCNYMYDWRNLPEDVLREYERLCIIEERNPTL